ncbi:MULTISPECIES: helix-turn-helix domain-containing protein [Marinobacter]|uniref:helix-turn-helix domain-containing protein n=1 Tax=Marinobacter TaxID=2742 RepID=UPI000376A55A|nr:MULTISPECIES: helix-turn-helix domain-containing protein [Marinobacter]PFG07855.1 AlpA family transcriptional regulator [Marinobacter sp. LV10MA510-1]PFG53669.1 AlpA family transcriptional regulator [Marinobacter sp. LV10R520-4]
MKNNQTDQIMTLEELANYLKISKSTVYKLAQEGRIPGQKLGKQWRFGKQAIDDWLSHQARTEGRD